MHGEEKSAEGVTTSLPAASSEQPAPPCLAANNLASQSIVRMKVGHRRLVFPSPTFLYYSHNVYLPSSPPPHPRWNSQVVLRMLTFESTMVCHFGLGSKSFKNTHHHQRLRGLNLLHGFGSEGDAMAVPTRAARFQVGE